MPFPPRLLYSNPSVRCDAPPPLEMQPVPGPQPARGTIRWTYRPSQDSAAVVILEAASADYLQLFDSTFTGNANGGFIATANERNFYVGITADGSFDFVKRAYRSRYGPMFLMPATLVSRQHSEVSGGGGQLDLYRLRGWSGSGAGGVEIPPAPADFPGTSVGEVEFIGPTVLRDGTIVWLTTDRTLMAACPDGRVRWVLEFYNIAATPRVFGAADGTLVLVVGSTIGFHRIDSDGTALLSSYVSTGRGGVLGYSERCGFAMMITEGTGRDAQSFIRYRSGPEFTTVSELPFGDITSDCGVWATDNTTNVATRYRADGSVGFTYSRQPTLELADGTWLMVEPGHALDAPPRRLGMTVVSDDGTVIADHDFDASVIGNRLLGPYLLTPDGVLFTVAASDSEGTQFVAIEVGIGPAREKIGGGINWARDNATWH